jgi:hypothetical protein
MSTVERGDYKGNPMLVIKQTDQDKFPFSFGLKKAKLILEHIVDIEEFVAVNGGR